jgi:hypothetical protein
MQRRDNVGVTVGLIVMVLAFLALSPGMSCVRVVAHLPAGDLAIRHVKDDEALAAAEVL